jgi:dienelactone hydrolase
VQLFRSTLLKPGKPAEIIIYPKAQPGFADPDGGAYDEQAATESVAEDARVPSRQSKSKPR